MATQFSTRVRNATLDQREATIGTAPKLRIYSGTPPANPAAALSGNTLLADLALPSDWMGAASGGVKSLAGSWTGTGAASGTATFYRILDNGTTNVDVQGTVGVSVALSTSAATSANGNVLTFAATTGVVAGMNVSGTGIPTGATVVAVTSTTVTLSHTSTAGVANGASITFAYDLGIDNTSIAVGQTVTVSSYQWTESNA